MRGLLGGSWVVISGAISPLISIVTLLITPLRTTHEPPSGGLSLAPGSRSRWASGNLPAAELPACEYCHAVSCFKRDPRNVKKPLR